MKKLWFRRKTYGWGWYPNAWQGWVILLLYVAYIVWQFKKVDSLSHSGSDTLYGFSVPFIIATLVLIVVCIWKGESPRWQWGKKDDEKLEINNE